MKKNKIGLFIKVLFVLFCQFSIAQTTVSGKIIDQSNKSIPYAHIRIENTNIGTISNENGNFKLTTRIDTKNNVLIISSLGFETKRISVKKDYQIITLFEDVTQLSEIVIVAKDYDYAKELIKKAINAIPDNYPKIEERHTGFFREVTTWESEEDPIYIAEAVIEAIKKDYSKQRGSGDVTLKEYRKYEGKALDTLSGRIYAGSHHIHRFDLVARRQGFLKNPDRYNYKILDTLRQNGKNVFKVSFKKKRDVSGYVYIMDESFAIIEADIEQTENFIIPGINRQYLKINVSYEQGDDNIWRFKNSYYKTVFKRQGRLLNLSSEYVSTDVKSNTNDIPYLERLQFSEILIDKTKKYNPNFWNNYTIISPNEISETLFSSIDYSKEKDASKKSFIDILKSPIIEYGVTWTSINIASNTISYSNEPINIQQNNEAMSSGSANLALSFFYPVTQSLMVGYANESKLSKTGLNSNDLVVAGTFNLNPKGRPLTVSPRLHMGQQDIQSFVQDFNIKESVRIDGSSINLKNTVVFLSQQSFRLKPSLVLRIEQSKRLDFFVGAAYNISLNNKSGLLFRKKGFSSIFSKGTFLKNGNENLSISYKNQILRNTFSINAGMIFKFF